MSNAPINKALVRRRFARRLAAYEQCALVQGKIAAALAEKIAAQTEKYQPFARVLEVGCGTGLFTRELLQRLQVGTLYLNDLVAEALPPLRDALQGRAHIELLPGDAERSALPENLDAIVGASALQWLHDLPRFLERAARALRPGGWLGFNLFGPGNLREIRELTGMGLPGWSAEALQELLRAHFDIPELNEQTHTQYFDEPMQVLRHLQQTGVTGTGAFRWSKRALRDFEEGYRKKFAQDGKITLSWAIIYIVCKKR